MKLRDYGSFKDWHWAAAHLFLTPIGLVSLGLLRAAEYACLDAYKTLMLPAACLHYK